ncbi:hypothetical protein [Roseospira goensis]|uniref:Hemin receptor n=1 Tax=Roseospira goensis TaxID=391922 RepID=A0A7W6RYY8_9PROT|nr:hypothetical protein [Roseospira goensis]MBB4285815.1 hypothetical protein [Roseospira goensis]
MTSGPEPDPPAGVGPHEGRELALMLAGEKPLALFCDIVPSPYVWPDDRFAPHVATGRLVMWEYREPTPDGRHTVRWLYYALPGEEWRIDRAHALRAVPGEEACTELGRLLGYREADIRAFVAWLTRTQSIESQTT